MSKVLCPELKPGDPVVKKNLGAHMSPAAPDKTIGAAFFKVTAKTPKVGSIRAAGF